MNIGQIVAIIVVIVSLVGVAWAGWHAGYEEAQADSRKRADLARMPTAPWVALILSLIGALVEGRMSRTAWERQRREDHL